MTDLVRAGRTPEELSREFEPSAAWIVGWVRRADAEDGTRPDVMTAAEREESAPPNAWFAAAPNGRTS